MAAIHPWKRYCVAKVGKVAPILPNVIVFKFLNTIETCFPKRNRKLACLQVVFAFNFNQGRVGILERTAFTRYILSEQEKKKRVRWCIHEFGLWLSSAHFERSLDCRLDGWRKDPRAIEKKVPLLWEEHLFERKKRIPSWSRPLPSLLQFRTTDFQIYLAAPSRYARTLSTNSFQIKIRLRPYPTEWTRQTHFRNSKSYELFRG